MKVKALCKIIYGGKIYNAGEEFDVDKLLPNTKEVIIDGTRSIGEMNYNDEKPFDDEKPSEFAEILGQKTRKRR